MSSSERDVVKNGDKAGVEWNSSQYERFLGPADSHVHFPMMCLWVADATREAAAVCLHFRTPRHLAVPVFSGQQQLLSHDRSASTR
jgi:hypothetical protein